VRPSRDAYVCDNVKRAADAACARNDDDRPEARERFLRAFRVAKAAHATLAFACWLMAILCAIVHSCRGFDEQVLHVRKFRDLGFGRRKAAQLIGDDLEEYRLQVQHTLKEAFGDGLVPPPLHQDVEFPQYSSTALRSRYASRFLCCCRYSNSARRSPYDGDSVHVVRKSGANSPGQRHILLSSKFGFTVSFYVFPERVSPRQFGPS